MSRLSTLRDFRERKRAKQRENAEALIERLEETEEALALALAYIRGLEDGITGRRQNPARVPNGFFGFVGKQVKKRRTRKKAERAIAKEAVATYRATAAKAKHKAADKDEGWF
jgi:hypothetical protein